MLSMGGIATKCVLHNHMLVLSDKRWLLLNQTPNKYTKHVQTFMKQIALLFWFLQLGYSIHGDLLLV